ncbi:MAG: Na/Pi symporter [Pseudomonadota bacterium]
MDNIVMIVQALGGLGLFLLGMIIMTEGLRELAGDAIRSALMRFTSSPVTGAATGAISTAILQSSSATTVAAVGFVGAGLMTFGSSLGIIFGANIGTTITGWLVALFGFKLKLGTIMLPLILVGAILRLFAAGRLSSTGYALAGFGLIFVGIGAMQNGLSGMQGLITPETLPPDTWPGRIQIVLLGTLVTVITQSSSAGVAATMTALYAGAISFEQGLALIIGMDVGTTITAVLASIGGTIGARRTGISHLIYNLFTGSCALLLISPYIMTWQYFMPDGLTQNAEIALVAFHTLFNTIGVLLILPVTDRFARFIKKLIPEEKSSHALNLDSSLLEMPELSLAAVQDAVLVEYILLLNHVDAILDSGQKEKRADLARMQLELDETHAYLDAIQLQGSTDASWDRMLDLIHTLDHLQRMHERCEEDEDRAITARETRDLSIMHEMLATLISNTIAGINKGNWGDMVQLSRQAGQAIIQQVGPQRDNIAASIADGRMTVPEATDCLEAVRWLNRVSHHVARINYHLHRSLLASGK